MSNLRCAAVAVVGTCLLAAPVPAAPPAAPEQPAAVEKVEPTDFESLVRHVRKVRKAGEWKRAGWTDAEIEQALARVVEQAKAAAKLPELRVGVPLAGLAAGDVPLEGRSNGRLHVVENGKISFAEGSVVLADGSVRVSFATDCVIVARGSVYVAHGSGNVIVAGQYVHVSHDGSLPRRGGGRAGERPGGQPGGQAGRQSAGSVILAGQLIDVSHAHGSILSSGGAVRVAHANGVTFVNSPDVDASHENGCRHENGIPLALAPPKPTNPLEGRIKVTQVVANDGGRGDLALIEHAGVELAVRPGAPLRGPDAKPLDGLDGWTLAFVAENYAMFARGDELAGFVLPPRR